MAGWAMVTGASRGIGRAIAMALAHDGWNVALHCRGAIDLLETVSETIRTTGQDAFTLVADFEDANAGPRLVEEAWRRTGGLDVWVHNAGADTLTGAEAQWSYERKLDLLTRVDLWGTMLTCRAIGKRMLAQGHGAIVTIGWDQAYTGMEGDSGELFAGIKGGVMSFSRSLAKSLAPSVRVNCVAPGWIRTAWGEHAADAWQARVRRETPLGRWGDVDDIANMTRFLVSPAATFVTGQTILVNGGAVTS